MKNDMIKQNRVDKIGNKLVKYKIIPTIVQEIYLKFNTYRQSCVLINLPNTGIVGLKFESELGHRCFTPSSVSCLLGLMIAAIRKPLRKWSSESFRRTPPPHPVEFR